MNWKKLCSNLIWIAALVFLAWYFLWPVHPTLGIDAGDVRIYVMEADETGQRTQTTYLLPEASSGHDALNNDLRTQSCFRTISPSNKNTDQSFQWEQQVLIQATATTAIYTYGGSRLTYNNTILRVKGPEILHEKILDLLRSPEAHGIICEGSEPVTTENLF